MSPVSILIIDKNGSIKESNIKNYNEDELYKKGGFKSSTDFKKHCVWKNIKINNKNYTINVYGKIVGRANSENKYEFPPPIDNTLFFGSCVIVNVNNDNVDNLYLKEWKCIYEKLYGGFESLNDESDESDESDDDLPKTKSGYVKDDFIVDDDYEDDSDYKPKTKAKKKIIKITKNVKTSKKPETVFVSTNVDSGSEYTNELVEEDYI